jgi:hypothetical protein
MYVLFIPIIDIHAFPAPHTVFLSRMLLKSRSGIRQTDSTVNHIVRKIFQTGCLATAWALLALATWFLLPNNSAYRVFDVTSGTVYTHVSDCFLVPLSHFEGGRVTLGHIRDTSVTHPPSRAHESFESFRAGIAGMEHFLPSLHRIDERTTGSRRKDEEHRPKSPGDIVPPFLLRKCMNSPRPFRTSESDPGSTRASKNDAIALESRVVVVE